MTTDPTNPLEVSLADTAWLRALARRLVRDAARADDLVQETLIAAWTRPRAHASIGRGWLATVLRNAARQALRRDAARARREAGNPSELAPSTDDLIARVETMRRVARRVTELEEPYRTALMLRFYEGLTSRAIARRMRVPEGTVRWRIHEGLARLRDRLDRDWGGSRAAWCAALLPVAGERAAAGIVGWKVLLQGVLLMKSVQAAVLVACAALLWWGLSPAPARQNAAPARAQAPSAPEHGAGPLATDPAAIGHGAAARHEVPASTARVSDGASDRATPTAGATLRVLDALGRPLEGAEVIFMPLPVHRARTDADGRATLIGEVDAEQMALLRREATFRVASTDHVAVAVRGVLALGEIIDLGTVVLEPAGSIHGHVVDERGLPVGGAAVVAATDPVDGPVRRIDAVVVPRAQSGADGAFLLAGVPPGLQRVNVTHAGFAPASSEEVLVEAARARADVRVELRRLDQPQGEVALDGVVLDPDGRAVADAAVLIDYEIANGRASSTLRTAADGRFSFRASGLGVHDIVASDPRNRWRSVQVTSPGRGPVELRLGVPRWLWVDVITHGAPVREFVVVRRDPGGLTIATQGEHGSARLLVPIHAFTATVEADGYAASTIGPLEPDLVPERIAITLEPLAGVRGRVLRDGEPVAGTEVVALALATGPVLIDGFPSRFQPGSLAQATTGGDGSFQLTVREPGPLVVRARAPGAAPVEMQVLDYDPAQGLAGLRLDLSAGGAIEGRVLATGLRTAFGTIVAASRGDGVVRTVRARGDGTFRFEHLVPGPWWVVETDALIQDDHSWQTGLGRPSEIPSNCTVYDGATTVFDLDLTRCRLLGRLRLGELPLGGWNARVVSSRSFFGFGVESQQTLLDADGTFTLDTRNAGRFTLWLSPPLHAPVSHSIGCEIELRRGDQVWSLDVETGAVEIEPHAEDLRLTWSRGGVRGRIAIHPPADGVARIDGVPIGRVQVERETDATEASIAAGAALAEADVRRAETTRIALPPAPPEPAARDG